MSTLPIADYALLSDCHSAGLVSRDGSVDWLCFPRFDSPSVMARILDPRGGHFAIRVLGATASARRYLEQTMVVETTHRGPTGVCRVVDALAVGRNERGHELGRDSPHALLRQVECLTGHAELEVEYRPRPEYALVEPLLAPIDGGLVARGGADVLWLSSPVAMEIAGSTARGRLTLRQGDAVGFALHHGLTWRELPRGWNQQEIAQRLADTIAAWRSWSDLHQTYDGPWRDLVQHSGRVLQALSYQPTGAIVAAATTSLPEAVGGERNWDYRYAWVRDASLTLDALWVAACPDEAHQFFRWLAGAGAAGMRRGADLQIMFGVGGEHDLTERTLSHLAGWRGSRPVRVGNAAWSQRQLDVYGELLGAAHRLADQLGELDPQTREFLVEATNAGAARWQETDHGIWELRSEPQHFLYSKLMCWTALDRAIALAPQLRAQAEVERWTREREQIRAVILTEGWSEKGQSFAQALGSDELDASSLMIPIVGLLSPDDPRVLATLRATEERLTGDYGLVYRYRTHDGLPGEEGAFLLCTFWLAQAQALSGQVERARATFERAAGFANDIGLLSEEVDPKTGELLGNFPQAFSHVGLVNAAWAISEAGALFDDVAARD